MNGQRTPNTPITELPARFTRAHCLGSGGFGIVFAAHDLERRTTVAVKRLMGIESGALLRFKEEFRSLAYVTHPNLVQLYELLSLGNDWYFTMELVEGSHFLEHVIGQPRVTHTTDNTLAGAPTPTARTLPGYAGLTTAEWQARQQAVTPRDAFEDTSYLDRLRPALVQLAAGIGALHGAGKLHRDLKPSNVLVTEAGRVVVLDFGLVANLGTDGLSSGGEGVVGTPAYMAPEQALGRQVSPASDWYSFGVMMFEALTGLLPEDPRARVHHEDGTRSSVDPRTYRLGLPDDLATLCTRLLEMDPRRRPGADEIARLLGGRGSAAVPASSSSATPFVGRQAEMASLGEAFAAMREGRAIAVHLHGPSGIGKSALVRRFLDGTSAAVPTAVVLSGRCYERESVPYKALDSLIDALTQHLQTRPAVELEALVPPEAAALARLFPVFRRVCQLVRLPRPSDEADRHEQRRRAFDALRELLRRMTERGPVVLHIDDLHWGDADSAVLLRDLERPPDAPPLLFLYSYRSDDLSTSACLRLLLGGRAAVTHQSGVDVREVALRPLPVEEAVALAQAIRPDADAAAIAAESGGSPFFVAALARRDAGSGTAASLGDLVIGQVAHLEPRARRLLEVVAVAGCPVERGVAVRASGLLADEQAAVSLLVAGHLCRLRPTSRGDEIETYHDKIREAVARSLSDETLRATHLDLARALEGPDADPEALAQHYHAAGDSARALRHAERAAERAGAALAFDRAAALYRMALDLVAPAERRPVERKLGEALANAGRGAESARVFLDASIGAPAADALDLKRRAAEQLLRSGHIGEGLAATQAVLTAVDSALPASPMGALASLLLRRAHLRLRGLGFTERRATEIDPRELTRLDALWSVGNGLGAVDVVRGADFQARHLIAALSAGEPQRISRSLSWEGILGIVEGGAPRARGKKLLVQSRAIAERIQHSHTVAWSVAGESIAAWCDGRWLDSLAHCDRSIAIWRAQPLDCAWEIASMNAIWELPARFMIGDLAELDTRCRDYIKSSEERGDVYATTTLRTYNLPLVWLAADEPEAARRESREAIERWGTRHGWHLQHWCDLLAQASASLYVGEGRAALARLGESWRDCERSMLHRMQNIRMLSLHLRARTAVAASLALRDPSLRRVALDDGRALEKLEPRWLVPAVELLRAAVAYQEGRREPAAALLEAAERGFLAVDMPLYAAAATRRRGELRGDAETVTAATVEMTRRHVRNPARMTALLAPGFPST